MAALSEPEILTDFWSSAVQAKTTATKYGERRPHILRFHGTNLRMHALISAFVSFARTTRFASFPDHLVIQIKKFTFGLDWVPKKLGEHAHSHRHTHILIKMFEKKNPARNYFHQF